MEKAKSTNLQSLWQISLATTAEAEEAVLELLENHCGRQAVTYRDAETGRTTVSVFLPDLPRWEALRGVLRRGLNEIRRAGLDAGRGRFSLRRIRSRNWAESWKRHFKPLEIGQALLIKPSWSKRRRKAGQVVIVLDPGLSFGTGHHPTTAFCLQQLAAHRDPRRPRAFLDIGTGSGILAIAAAKLGYAPVDAFDFDPAAVRIARANARRNRVTHRVRIYRADLTQLPVRSGRQYDVICCNLISTLLVSHWKTVIARLKPGGLLVLAGILRTEFPQIVRVYRSAKLKLVASRSGNEWRSGAFQSLLGGPRISA